MFQLIKTTLFMIANNENRYLYVEPESTTKDDLICQSIEVAKDIPSKAIFKLLVTNII